MPQIATWSKLPPPVQRHLNDRMKDRGISREDLLQLRLWLESHPVVPQGEWFKDFGSFKLCGEGAFPKTFLTRGQSARGTAL